jgi:hypothetical protein
MRRYRRLLLSCLAFVLFVVGADAQNNQRYAVSVDNLALTTGERITNFEIQITAGAFRDISNLPVGWEIDVDNDASWQTTVKASCQVGAASLEPKEFKKLKFLIEKYEYGDAKLGLLGTVYVTRDFKKGSRIPLKMSDFTVTPLK